MVTKPTIGQNPWGTTLNNSLDELEGEANDGDQNLQDQIDDILAQLAVDEDLILDRSLDEANTATSLTANAFTILPETLAVPPTAYPVTVEWGGGITVTVAGSGNLGIHLADITTGSPVIIGESSRGLAFIAGTYSAIQQFYGIKLLPPSTAWRYLRLYGGLFRDSGSLAASNSASGAAAAGPPALGAGYNQTFLQVRKS